MKHKIVAKVLVQNAEHKFLVLTRSLTDESSPGKPDFPGGGVEENETYQLAAVRELQEESGISTTPEALALLYAFTRTEDDGEIIVRMLFGLMVNNPEVALSHEHSDFTWVDKDQLGSLFASRSWGVAVDFVMRHNILQTDFS